jgi:hypothetical protein
MRRILQVYAVALGSWVALLLLMGTIGLVALSGLTSPNTWHVFEVQPTAQFGPGDLWLAWAQGAAVLVLPPLLGGTVWLWWKGRGGHAT